MPRRSGAVICGSVGGVLVGVLGLSACTNALPRPVVDVASAAARPSAGGSTWQLSSSVRRDVAIVWPRLGRIWPGADFSKHSVIVTDGRCAYLLDARSGGSISLDELKKHNIGVPRPGGFEAITWKGRKSIVVRPPEGAGAAAPAKDPLGMTSPDAAGYTFGLATHEQFHPDVQYDSAAPWHSLIQLDNASGGAGRAEEYPLRADPRIDRAMVYNSLLLGLRDPARRAAHLAQAAYWNQRWTDGFPAEAKGQASVDLLEGTAEYVQQSALAMAAVRDPDDPAQIRARLTRTLRPMKVAAKGAEPYAIGTAALLTADAAGRDVKKTLTTKATTPLAELLRGVTPAGPQTAPKDVTDGITRSVARTNRQLAPVIEPFVAGLQDRKKLVLLLPADSVTGSMSGTGFYTTRQLPVTITTGAGATFNSGSGAVRLDKVTVAEMRVKDKDYYALPLDPDNGNFTLEDNRLTLKGGHMHGSIVVVRQTDDGQRFLYAQ